MSALDEAQELRRLLHAERTRSQRLSALLDYAASLLERCGFTDSAKALRGKTREALESPVHFRGTQESA